MISIFFHVFFLQIFPPRHCLNPDLALPWAQLPCDLPKGHISCCLCSSDGEVALVSSLFHSIPSLAPRELHWGSHRWSFLPHPLIVTASWPLAVSSLSFPDSRYLHVSPSHHSHEGNTSACANGPSSPVALYVFLCMASSPGPFLIFAARVQMKAHLCVQILTCYPSS